MYPYIYMLGREVPVYGLCFVVGVFAAALYLIFRCKAEKLCWENAIVIALTGLGVGLFGAKFLYIIVTFKLDEFIAIIHSDIMLLFSGGFVFYGGLIGGILGAVLGTRLAQCRLSEYENVLIPIIPLVHFFGRIGCFCAGCCYGKPTESIVGVIYTNPIGDTSTGIPLIPIQLYEALYNLTVFILLLFIKNKVGEKRFLLPSYLILYAIGRFFIEFFRYDYCRGIYFGISTSQLISIFFIIIGVLIGILRKYKAQ